MSRAKNVLTEEDGYDMCPNCKRPVMPSDANCPFCKTGMEEDLNDFDVPLEELIMVNEYPESAAEEDYAKQMKDIDSCHDEYDIDSRYDDDEYEYEYRDASYYLTVQEKITHFNEHEKNRELATLKG